MDDANFVSVLDFREEVHLDFPLSGTEGGLSGLRGMRVDDILVDESEEVVVDSSADLLAEARVCDERFDDILIFTSAKKDAYWGSCAQ